MTHQEAADTLAAERYLLGELPAGDREAFEAHYFSCDVCADDLRSAAAHAAGCQGRPCRCRDPRGRDPDAAGSVRPGEPRVVSLGRPALGRGGGAGRDRDLPVGLGGSRHFAATPSPGCARAGAAASREPRQRAFRWLDYRVP